MKRYDKNRPCKKCGEKGASSEYVHLIIPSPEKVIERKCKNCGFTWHELPLDAPENNDSMAGQNEKSNHA